MNERNDRTFMFPLCKRVSGKVCYCYRENRLTIEGVECNNV